MRPGARATNERALGGRPANSAAQAKTGWPVGESSARARPWPGGADSPWANRVELVMQALLQDAPSSHELATMTNRSQQRFNDIGLRPPAGALVQQPHQRCAVAIVSLDPPRSQLPARRRRL